MFFKVAEWEFDDSDTRLCSLHPAVDLIFLMFSGNEFDNKVPLN